MRRVLTAITVTCLPAALLAGVDEAVTEQVLPGMATFAEKAAALDEAAQAGCEGDALQAAYHAAFDAWLGVSHIQFGPMEDEGLSLSFAFWPDPKDQTGRSLTRLAGEEDPVVGDPDGFAAVSVAAQGFFALERMLFEAPVTGDYACDLTRAIAASLSRNASILDTGWRDFAPELTEPGATPTARYRSDEEAMRALYTALSTGLEFDHDQRLGRPLGTFDRPRPRRAEARRSERSLQNLTLSLTALRELAVALADTDLPETLAAFDDAIARAEALEDPTFAGVADPGSRIRVEALQRAVRGTQIAVADEIGAALGIAAGFNALDGD